MAYCIAPVHRVLDLRLLLALEWHPVKRLAYTVTGCVERASVLCDEIERVSKQRYNGVAVASSRWATIHDK